VPVNWREMAEQIVLEILFDRLEHEMNLNAAAGYVLTPGLVSPEVLERPGWVARWAPPGTDRYVVAEMPGIPTIGGYGDIPAYVDMEEVLIRPQVWATVQLFCDEHPRWYGLGIYPEGRVYVIFSADVKP
jgi:hypothetical protein